MASLGPHTKVELSWGAVVIIALLGFFSVNKLGLHGGVVSTVFIAASLLLHEVAHLLAAVGCGVKVKAIGMSIKGAYLRRSDSCDPGTEVVIAVCGPLTNLLLFTIFRGAGPVLDWVADLNLVLVLANLVPFRGSDGHRILVSLGRLIRPHLGFD
ncbi:MAG TPA: site-2 protease family protein [Candidatus Nanoarchaeia archaeon]|nr:site-2 protease family protein [Candidatus Nanoarchaeia archaeon]